MTYIIFVGRVWSLRFLCSAVASPRNEPGPCSHRNKWWSRTMNPSGPTHDALATANSKLPSVLFPKDRHSCQNCASRDRALKRQDGHDCSWLRSLIDVERSSSFISLHSLLHPLFSAVIRSLRFTQHRLCCFFDTYVNTITVSWRYSRQPSGQRKTPNLTSRASICINDTAACKHDVSPVRRGRATKALRI